MANQTVENLGRPAALLLVEDNYGDVVLMREALRSARIVCDLAVASDGEAAMDMLRRQGQHCDAPRPDLILLDLNLPRMDGREVLREIKTSKEFRRIPVVVFTSSSDDIDVALSYDLSASSYVSKPMDFDKLKHIVNSIGDFWFSVVVLPPLPEGARYAN